jgi:hypothetical protein
MAFTRDFSPFYIASRYRPLGGWYCTSAIRPFFSEINCILYFTAKSFSQSFSDNLAPSSDNHTDLYFVAGSEM